jgi:branched-chain amino acid transport system substrate-binding protein
MGESKDPSERLRGWRRRGLAIAALGVLLLAACGGDDDNGGDSSGSSDETETTVDAAALLGPENQATGDPVKIGMVSDGATDAFDNTDELRAAKATADYFNEHKGGIGGRPIEVVTCETGADPAGATDCANQLVEQDVAAVALSQSAVADSVWEPLHEAGVPTMWFQTSGQGIVVDTESSFVIVNPLTTLFGLPVSVAKDTGSDKVEFVIIDVPQARTGVEQLAPAVMGKANLDYDVVPIAPGTADMTSQMQQVAASGAGVVHITGNDAFCIAALNGLNAVGYDGAIAVVSQCITDATREAVPSDVLDGVYVTSSVALKAADDPTWQLYVAVMDTYGQDVEDVNNNTSMGGYTAMSSLLTSLQGISGDITPESVIAAIKAMPESELPGGGGVKYQCGGSALAMLPAVCSNEWLQTTLDADGNPTTYTAVDSTDILP